ncbi:MAG: chromosome segregation protein SMC [Nanoarchaeota archaeon]|nr:chromosome segregation protein SMC [Nanoarchaeota archaeon]
MAIIKSMHLKGFKSFAKSLDLQFGPDFNCVIGPNGSGKSNIMDGLCFVLGKLSAKSMRAEKSSNLIFNGGKKGSALKEAEVSIVFTNKEKEFPIDSEEVKITRVIKDTGNSVYKINDNVMTRQQILELLAAAKIDPDGHNIILQGDIVRFMEMRAENRRELIEDIAGISIFEDKKSKAMISLNKVESHLNDATIILKERETYLRELKKDKEQAEKYKNLEGNIKSNKATYLHTQIKEKETKLEETESKIKKQEDIIKNFDIKTEEIRKKIEQKKQELKKINSDIEEKGEKEAITIQDDIEKLKTDLARNLERLTACKNELTKIAERKKQLLSSLEDTKKTIIDLEESKNSLAKEITLLKEKELKQSQSISQLKGKLGISSNLELEKIESVLDEKIKLYEELQIKNQELLQKKFKLDVDISALNEKISSVEKLEKTSNMQQLKKDIDRVTKELEKNLSEDTFLFTQLKKAREDYSKANEELFRVQTQKSSMKVSAEADMAIKKIKSLKNPGVFGTVSELGEVDKKFSTALEVAAGPRTKSIVVRDDKVAADCIKTLKDSKAGIATFLPMNKIKSRPLTNAKGAGIYGNAVDLIDFDPRFKDIFSYVFGNTIVVESIDTARHIGIGKSRMVTLEGDLIEVSGAMVGGYRTRRIGLGFQEKSVSSNLNRLTEQIEKLSKVKSILEKKKLENENKITEQRDIKSNIEAGLIKYERTSSGISLTELIKQRDALKTNPAYADFSEVGKAMEKLNLELQKLKAERQKIKSASKTVGGVDEMEALESRRLKTREDIVERNTQIKNIDIQIRNIYQPEQEKIQQLTKNSGKELEDFDLEAKTLSELIKNQQSALSGKESEKSKFQKAYKDLFSERNNMSEAIQKLESSIIIEAEKEKTVRDRINDCSIIRAKVKAEIEALKTEYEEFKGVSLRRGLSAEQLKLEIKNFEQMLSKIGNVNMRALEVYEEIHTEYNKLIEKRDKLAEEKEDVLKMIEEIETNKKSIFMKTYKELNKNFSRIFMALSRKGEASLELENKESPLEGGVDIRVRITGNKYLDIKSLSGGEKTMAALAFIFAIQEYHPMAFYLLDEVDAALDKKNSELLAELVAKYSRTAQYIMISHNDNVITEADYVYGVSMHETGISKVVSLKL